MLRSLAPLSLVLALVAGSANAAAPKTLRLRVVAASSIATVTYSSAVGDEFTKGKVSATTSLGAPARKLGADGSLGSRGGRVTVSVRGKLSEQVTLGQREDPSSPYVEQNCDNPRKIATRGGLAFTRLPGSRVRVTWSFPDAQPAFCPGPTGVGKLVRSKMTRVLPVGKLLAKRSVVVVSGSAPFKQGDYSGRYRWRASVTLVRV